MKFFKEKPKWVWITLGVLVLAQIAVTSLSRKQVTTGPVDDRSIDTFVPLGYQLIPIKISNQAELSALMKDFAVVDLYVNGKERPLLQAVRIIRSPNNPDVFAVLAEQNQAGLVLDEDKSFYVAIRNPKHVAAKVKNKTRRTILEH